MNDAILPFHLAVPETELADLRERLGRTRWPDAEAVEDWSQGVPRSWLQTICNYWAQDYDWRRCERFLNDAGQYRTQIEGLGIHFLHVRSPEPSALPVILTHGWPGSVLEFRKIIGPLTDPVAHGGVASDAFHIVAPSLPGYGFSDRPATTGWTVEIIADAWIALMRRLGYTRFVAQGGDWGSAVTGAIGASGAPEVLGIHLNMVNIGPRPEDRYSLNETERTAIADLDMYTQDGSGYAHIQRTRPQTIGYGLTDSPAAQAAWILEKFAAWSDCDGDPLTVFTKDELIDNVMLYWLPATAASSARLYWESFPFRSPRIDVPVACSIYPKEIFRSSRRWASRRFQNIVYWNELDRGGHFAALERPEKFVSELRTAFQPMRQG